MQKKLIPALASGRQGHDTDQKGDDKKENYGVFF
jgi:hypothetical protein